MRKFFLGSAAFLALSAHGFGCGADDSATIAESDGGAGGDSDGGVVYDDAGHIVDGSNAHDGAVSGDGASGGDGSSGGDASSNGDSSTAGPIQTVFVIMMENHSLTDVAGSASAPYYNNTLIPAGARGLNYKTPPGNHPSEPNYIWLEAGDNLGITNDNPPSQNHQSTTEHLVTLLKNANITWKAYAEDITAGACPIADVNEFAVRHTPMLFFDDVVGNPPATTNAYCIAHVRPYSELAGDLSGSMVARYNLISPNLCNDTHGSGFNMPCPNFGINAPDLVKLGDDWLKNNIPAILASQAYQNNGAIFILWDEGSGLVTGSDGPLPFIVLSPKAKTNYSNNIAYTHSSTLKTLAMIFGVTALRGAAGATSLSDLFTSFP